MQKAPLELYVLDAIVGTTLLWHVVGRLGTYEGHWNSIPVPLKAAALAFMLFFIATVEPGDFAFIYFQF